MAYPVGKKNTLTSLPQNYVSKLPPDLTTQLFIRVHPRDLLACHSVCKQWGEVLQSGPTWQHLLTNHFSSITPPKESEDCKAVYMTEFRRLDANFKDGVFCLKPYIPVEGDAVSLAIASGSRGITIWDSSIGKIKVNVNESSPELSIEIYQLTTGKLVNTFPTGKRTNYLISGSKLFTGHEDGNLRIWEIEKGICTKTIRAGIPSEGRPAGATSLAIDKDKLFIGCLDGQIKIYDLKKEEVLKTMKGSFSGAFHMVVRDGHLMLGSQRGDILLWKLGAKGTPTSDNPSTIFSEHKGQLLALAFAYGKLFSISLDNTIKCWDIKTERCVNTIKARQMIQGKQLNSFAFIDNQLFLKYRDNTMMMDFAATNENIVVEIGESMMRMEDSIEEDEVLLRNELLGRFAKMSGTKIDEITDIFSKMVQLLNEGHAWSEAMKEVFARRNKN